MTQYYCMKSVHIRVIFPHRKSPYSVRMRERTDQKHSKYIHFSFSALIIYFLAAQTCVWNILTQIISPMRKESPERTASKISEELPGGVLFRKLQENRLYMKQNFTINIFIGNFSDFPNSYFLEQLETINSHMSYKNLHGRKKIKFQWAKHFKKGSIISE